MGGAGRAVVALVAAVVVGAGIWWLRGETMSTHVPVDGDSRLAVVVDVDRHRAEAGHTLAEMVQAKVLTCRLEVRRADIVEQPEPVGEGRFRVVLQPSLDDTDQTQFEGCLEDWNVDHVLVDVVSMAELPGA